MFHFSEFKKQWLLLSVMLYFAFILTMHKWGHQGDMMFWMNWSKYIYNNGFMQVYNNPDCNYLPLYLYFLYFHVKIQGNLTDIQDNLYTLKYYTFVFDILGAYAAVWLVKDELKKMIYFFILMFNAAYLYNTVFWGQVDAIFTFFGFVALLLAIEKKPVLSILALTIALNFKLQALVFIPIVGVLLLPNFLSFKGIKKIVLGIVLSFILQTIILLPFIFAGKLGQVVQVIRESVGYYPFPTVGAFNVWSLLLPNVSIEGMYHISDAQTFGLISYKHIGNLMFVSATFLALFPMLNYFRKVYIQQQVAVFPIKNSFIIAALIALSFYFFNTEMHERYAHPALISLAAYSFLSKRFFPLLLGSVAYFLNMERICWYLSLHNETYMNGFIFKPRLIAGIYLILIIWLYVLLYRKEKLNEEELLLN